MTKKVLELFAGSRSIGKVAEQLGYEVFSSDIENFEKIDYQVNIFDFDVNKVPFIPDIIWASPPCTTFSVASIGKHWNKDHTPKTEAANIGVNIVKRTLDIIKYFSELNPNLKWFMENPRGKLRKLPVVSDLDITTVMYCKYSDSRMKPTDIWTNNLYSESNPTGWKPRELCFNGNKDCHHQPAPRGSASGTQGLKNPYERSKLPEEFCLEILKSVV